MKKCFLISIFLMSAFCAFSKTSAPTENPLYGEDGYNGYIELSIGSALHNYGINTSILTSHGYGTGFGLYAGLGTGLVFNPDYAGTMISIPIFTDFKYSFLDKSFSPYAAMKTGLSFSPENLKAGVYLSPSVGVDIRKHFSIFLKYDYETTSHIKVRFKKHTFSVGVAISF